MLGKKRSKKIIKGIIYLLILTSLVINIHYIYNYLITSPYFNLYWVEIKGTKYLKEDTLKKFLQLQPGINILSLNLRELNRRLRKHPWISEGRIKRQWPNALLVSITERKPIGRLDFPRNLLVATDGQMLPLLKSTQKLQLPLITGLKNLSTERAKLEQGIQLLKVLTASSMIADRGITRLDLSQADHPVVTLKNGITKIRLSTKQLDQKLYCLQAISPYMKKWGDGIAYIDLSFEGLVIIKPI
jgi:cell division protein FtsQ